MSPHLQQPNRARCEPLAEIRKEPAQKRAGDPRKGRHHGCRQPPARAGNARNPLKQPHNFVERREARAEDVLLARAAARHREQVAADDISSAHEFKAAGYVGAKSTVGKITQGLPHPGRQESVPAEDRAGGGHHHLETARNRSKTLEFSEYLGSLVGHGAVEGVEGGGFVARRGGVVEVMSHGAEGSGDHHAGNAVDSRGFEDVLRADHIGLEQLAPVFGVALNRRNHRPAVIHALATLHGGIHRLGIAEVARRTFDVEAIDGAVVETGLEQNADALSVCEQARNQIGAQVTRGTGHQHQARARSEVGPIAVDGFRHCAGRGPPFDDFRTRRVGEKPDLHLEIRPPKERRWRRGAPICAKIRR